MEKMLYQIIRSERYRLVILFCQHSNEFSFYSLINHNVVNLLNQLDIAGFSWDPLGHHVLDGLLYRQSAVIASIASLAELIGDIAVLYALGVQVLNFVQFPIIIAEVTGGSKTLEIVPNIAITAHCLKFYLYNG